MEQKTIRVQTQQLALCAGCGESKVLDSGKEYDVFFGPSTEHGNLYLHSDCSAEGQEVVKAPIDVEKYRLALVLMARRLSVAGWGAEGYILSELGFNRDGSLKK